MKIGIIGMGMVGSAVYANIKKDYQLSVRTFDFKNKTSFNLSTGRSILDYSYLFLCLPTPEAEDGSQNSDYLTQVLDDLIQLNYKGVVIIKSTVLYSNIEEYIYDLKIVYNPEFLNAISSIEDFRKQQYLVLGGDIQNTKQVEYMYEECFNLDYLNTVEHCSIKEAIDFKYTRNTLLAFKVAFWEMIHDLTKGNSRKMQEMLTNHSVDIYSTVGLDGSRGFGGACLPKDTKAWYVDNRHPLLKAVIDYNETLKYY